MLYFLQISRPASVGKVLTDDYTKSTYKVTSNDESDLQVAYAGSYYKNAFSIEIFLN